MTTNNTPSSLFSNLFGKAIIFIVALTLVAFLLVVILRLLGLQLNKSYFGYSQASCQENLNPEQLGPKGIEGCVFWSRNDYLQTAQGWDNQFKVDTPYCNQLKDNLPKPIVGRYNFIPLDDPKCSLSSFEKQKRIENWNYLASKEKDRFYYTCADRYCPKKYLFN